MDSARDLLLLDPDYLGDALGRIDRIVSYFELHHQLSPSLSAGQGARLPAF
jgi:hypothetical protein